MNTTTYRRTVRFGATLSAALMITGCALIAVPAAASDYPTQVRTCEVKSDYATTVAVLHKVGVPLRDVLANTAPELRPLARVVYDMAAATNTGDEAEDAARVGMLIFASCMVGGK